MNGNMTNAEAVRAFAKYLIDHATPMNDGTRVLTMPDIVDLAFSFVEERL